MKEMCQVERGRWLPLRISSIANADEIFKTAIEKHTLFKNLFSLNTKYNRCLKMVAMSRKYQAGIQRKV